MSFLYNVIFGISAILILGFAFWFAFIFPDYSNLSEHNM